MFGMNPMQMRKLMKQLNIKSEEIDAKRVVIELSDSKLIIENPKVTAIEMQGQRTYTILGEEKIEKASEASISEEDVRLVQEKTGKSFEEVKKALEQSKGDIALAIKSLTE
ncbi:MAG: nascent polypeptide-associated complex protein [Candidatus Iainarchaeum archaeon]|uniref:Nascent polypeptide-associated complex protein n=1 Tax=Candidatus Iainarchaeum sp. TaxID=3101447 RepID=A0A497JGW9_9ARCH|nr:MAG: nascent polypeptide-associated complex protein [Candidatus Diapherotrites archaeon]